jgi:hypothetical protein
LSKHADQSFPLHAFPYLSLCTYLHASLSLSLEMEEFLGSTKAKATACSATMSSVSEVESINDGARRTTSGSKCE